MTNTTIKYKHFYYFLFKIVKTVAQSKTRDFIFLMSFWPGHVLNKLCMFHSCWLSLIFIRTQHLITLFTDSGYLSCSFDHGLCGWIQRREGDLHWETTEDSSGISSISKYVWSIFFSSLVLDADLLMNYRCPHVHLFLSVAGGRYLTISEGGEKRGGRGAQLILPLTPPWNEGNLCLAFHHKMAGHHVGMLQVFVQKGRQHSPAVWGRTGGDGWRSTQITIWGNGLESVSTKTILSFSLNLWTVYLYINKCI